MLRSLWLKTPLIFVLCHFSSSSYSQTIATDWIHQTDLDQEDIAHSVAVNESTGAIYTAGSMDNVNIATLSLLGNVSSTIGITSLVGFGQLDGYLLKSDSNGTIDWIVLVGGNQNDEILDICIGPDGNIYFVGYYRNTFSASSINGGNTITLNDGNGQGNCFIGCYSPAGTLLWLKEEGGQGQDKYFSITSTSNGVVAIGTYEDQNSSENLQGINITNGYSDDEVFLAKYGFDGSDQWVMAGGSNGHDYDHSLAPEELHYSICSFRDTLYFINNHKGPNFNFYYSTNYNAANSAFNLTSVDNELDYMLGSVTNDGEIVWLRNQLHSGNKVKGMGIDADCSGVFCTALASGSLVWEGPSPGLKATTGGADMFLARYNRITGVPEWYRFLGNTENDKDIASSIKSDRKGNIYVSGQNHALATTGGVSLPGTGNGTGFIISYTTNGVYQSQYTISSGGLETIITDSDFDLNLDLVISG